MSHGSAGYAGPIAALTSTPIQPLQAQSNYQPSIMGGNLATANNSLLNQQSQLNAQQAAAQNIALNALLAVRKKNASRWVMAGKEYTFEEFVEAIFPEDSPQKTWFLLKFSGEKK
jgi:hypothetical protein